MMRLRAQREGAEGIALVVEKGGGRLSGLCAFQMMPLLMAVAIAIARFEAANFWMACVM